MYHSLEQLYLARDLSPRRAAPGSPAAPSRLRLSGAWARFTLAAACGLVAFLAAAASAHAYVYWADDSRNSIVRASNDGQQMDSAFILGASHPEGVAVDGSHVYWVNQGTGSIGRANLDGSGANPAFIPAATQAGTGVAVGGGYIFWTDASRGTIGRANLDGSGAIDDFITITGGAPTGVAVGSNYVYWSDRQGHPAAGGYCCTYFIGRGSLDGSGGDPAFISENPTGALTLSAPGLMAIDSGHLYWTSGLYSQGVIASANLDGSGLDTSFIPNTGGSSGVAVGGGYIFWSTNQFYSYLGSDPIGRANVDGTGLTPRFIANPGQPYGLAADDLAPAAAPGGTGGQGTGGGAGAGGGVSGSGGGVSAGGGGGGMPQPAQKCVVPNLRGRLLRSALSALHASHCNVGAVKRPKHGRPSRPGRKFRLVVAGQSPRAGTVGPIGAKVALTLVNQAVSAGSNRGR